MSSPTITWTTDPVDLPGVEPADPPTELVPGRLWHGGCPVDFDWIRRTGIDTVLDLADPDAHPPADALDGLLYLKAPLVDGDELPAPELVLGLADLVANLVEQGHRALVHCTFGRNRSGLVTALVVRRLLDLDGAAALAHVQRHRGGAVNNDAFADWLRTLPRPSR